MKPLNCAMFPFVGLGLVALIAGCSGDSYDGGYNAPQVTQTIEASDQTADPTDRVVVTRIKAADAGWVVIREASGSTFGDAIGHVAVPSGTSTNIAVTLGREIVDDETLYAVLHDDLGELGTFEFPGVDLPATEGGQVVRDAFVVHLPVAVNPSIAASAQTLNSLSTQVLVASANSNGPGWATIHEQSGGAVGADIGHALLSGGTNQSITVTLNRPAIDGETLYAMLHADLGTVGTYEFPGVDGPVSVDGEIVMVPFVVTVPASTPAVRLRVSSVGLTAYTFSQVEPSAFAGMLGAGGNNPTLTLRSGWRYEFTNTVYGPHPFELLTLGATSSTDVVLLSEAGLGTLEADAPTAWSDNGQGALRFTLSPSLAAVLTGYRCELHPVSMRGAVAIE